MNREEAQRLSKDDLVRFINDDLNKRFGEESYAILSQFNKATGTLDLDGVGNIDIKDLVSDNDVQITSDVDFSQMQTASAEDLKVFEMPSIPSEKLKERIKSLPVENIANVDSIQNILYAIALNSKDSENVEKLVKEGLQILWQR